MEKGKFHGILHEWKKLRDSSASVWYETHFRNFGSKDVEQTIHLAMVSGGTYRWNKWEIGWRLIFRLGVEALFHISHFLHVQVIFTCSLDFFFFFFFKGGNIHCVVCWMPPCLEIMFYLQDALAKVKAEFLSCLGLKIVTSFKEYKYYI